MGASDTPRIAIGRETRVDATSSSIEGKVVLEFTTADVLDDAPYVVNTLPHGAHVAGDRTSSVRLPGHERV